MKTVVFVDGDRALPVILGADGIIRHPGPADGAVASATLAAVLKEAPPCEVREERLSLEMILNAREVVLLGSGVGCVAVKSVDGVALDNTSGDELVSTFSEALDAAHHERRAAAEHRASDVAAFEDRRGGRSHKAPRVQAVGLLRAVAA